jgi:hypothetical protein
VQIALKPESKGRALTALRDACSKRFRVELAGHSVGVAGSLSGQCEATVSLACQCEVQNSGLFASLQLQVTVGGSLASPIREALDQA